MAASQQAARARASSNQKSSDSTSPFGATISLDEAMKILNVDKLEAEKVQKNYDHLFKINDKAKGGSFYLQSKVNGIVWLSSVAVMVCINLRIIHRLANLAL